MRLTKADLARWSELERRRLAVQRVAKDIARLQRELEDKFLEHVEANGGKLRAVTSCGYRLAIVLKNGSVEWKTEFLRVAGQEAAEQLVAAVALTQKKLVIEEPKGAAA